MGARSYGQADMQNGSGQNHECLLYTDHGCSLDMNKGAKKEGDLSGRIFRPSFSTPE